MSRVVAVLLGIAVAGLLLTSVFLAESANSAKRDARKAAEAVAGGPSQDSNSTAGEHDVATASDSEADGTASALQSFAGVGPENAAELAQAHEPYPAELPPVIEGEVVEVELTLEDVIVEIAPGVKYSAWGFAGGAPGPVIHVREGQAVRITLTNGGAIPHSIDFHAARVAPNEAFRDVAPGESITYEFVASDPGVFMYHCGTKPVRAHRQRHVRRDRGRPGDVAAGGGPGVRARLQ